MDLAHLSELFNDQSFARSLTSDLFLNSGSPGPNHSEDRWHPPWACMEAEPAGTSWMLCGCPVGKFPAVLGEGAAVIQIGAPACASQVQTSSLSEFQTCKSNYLLDIWGWLKRKTSQAEFLIFPLDGLFLVSPSHRVVIPSA